MPYPGGFQGLLQGAPPPQGGASPMARPVGYKEYRGQTGKDKQTLLAEIATYKGQVEQGDEDALVLLGEALDELHALRGQSLRERGIHEEEIKRKRLREESLRGAGQAGALGKPSAVLPDIP